MLTKGNCVDFNDYDEYDKDDDDDDADDINDSDIVLQVFLVLMPPLLRPNRAWSPFELSQLQAMQGI